MTLIGTETEYGVTATGRPDLDAHAVSALVVEACGVAATPVVEDSRHRMLGNGARLYVDHGHPEYAGPETTSPRDALVWELAGDRIVADAAHAASAVLGSQVRVFKNNTDGKGQSYGYHENVLLRRATPWALVEAALPALLVTRVVLAGAGRVGLGAASEGSGFQLSQRADFFERVTGLDTTRRRGIVNTRDEPLALPRSFRRLHVIAGDATRSPFATWLKLGVLALCLAALEENQLPVVELADPVGAFRAISRDTACTATVPLASGGAETAVGIQSRFLDSCDAYADRHAFPESDAVLRAWAEVLDALRADPMTLADRLDWVAKLALLEGYRARDGLGWEHPKLAQVDLAWAQLEAGGVVERLQRAGRLAPGPSEADVAAAMVEPPEDTRAHTRGRWVADHGASIVAAGWDSLLVRDSARALHTLGMPDPYGWPAGSYERGADVDRLIRQHRGARWPRAEA
ncbi:MAG: proteasome accessory factor PafA2 family protein [Actinomycetes bacterium]